MAPKSSLPYVPTSMDRLEVMMSLAGDLTGLKVADLGSGDGRVVREMAKRGAEAHGFEISSKLAKEAREKIKEEGLAGKAFIHQKDLFEVDVSQYDLITGYWITSMMESLEEKLLAEMKSGSRVISNYFTFPNWKPQKKDGSIYVYAKS